MTPDAHSTSIVSTPDDPTLPATPDKDASGGDQAGDFAPPLNLRPDEDVEAIDDPDLRHLIQRLPPEERPRLVAVLRRESLSHQGWLPTPQFMREYEALLPGLAERIVALPEREQAFRHRATENVIRRDYRLRAVGQWMGMAALLLLLAFCVFLVVSGAPEAAAWVAATVIVGTVGVFVTGQIVGGKASSKGVIEADE